MLGVVWGLGMNNLMLFIFNLISDGAINNTFKLVPFCASPEET